MEIKGQEWLCIERRGHRTANRVTQEDAFLFKLIEHLKCSPHTRTLQDFIRRTHAPCVLVIVPRGHELCSKRPVTGWEATAGLSKSSSCRDRGGELYGGRDRELECGEGSGARLVPR